MAWVVGRSKRVSGSGNASGRKEVTLGVGDDENEGGIEVGRGESTEGT